MLKSHAISNYYYWVALLLTFIASGCKPYVRQSADVYKAVSGHILKLDKKAVDDNTVVKLVMCAANGTRCQNTLNTASGGAEFYFFDPAMIHKELEQRKEQKKKQGSMKRWVILGVSILTIAAGSRALYRSEFIAERSFLHEIDSKVLTYIRQVFHKGGRGRNRDVAFAAIVAGIVGVIGAAGSGFNRFASNIVADENWQGQEKKLVDLFVYSKPVLVSKKQARSLLKMLAEYLPAKVNPKLRLL